MKNHTLISFVVAVGAIAFFGAGCNPVASLQQKAAETAAGGVLSAASGGKVNVNDNTVVFKDNKTGDIASYGENVKLPETFPKDIPIPSSAKLIGVNISAAQKTASVTFDSSEDVSAIVSFYATTLTKDGWKESESLSANGVEIRAYEKANVKISFTAGPKDEGGATATVVRNEE